MNPERHAICYSSMDISGLDILERYDAGMAKICITGDGRYIVNEPPIPPGADELYSAIVSRINTGVDIHGDPEALAGKFGDAFWRVAESMKRLEDAKRLFPHLDYYIRRNLVGHGLLDPLMVDPDIEDILCSAPGRPIRVVHARYSGAFNTLTTNMAFPDESSMENYIQKVYGRTGSEPTEARPISITHMEDGSRISATFGNQISHPGSAIAIRRFPRRPLTISDMLRGGTITPEMAAFLWTLLDAKAVGLVIGVTGSGKTTLLSSLVSMMNPRWRILTIEDTLELRIPHGDWVRLSTRRSHGMMGERFDITTRRLIDMSLTQRPDYEIVGETRLYDMDALFQSLGTGHGGLTSFHASTPAGALARMRGNGIRDGELGLVWFLAHSATVRRAGGYHRKVTDISEVVPDGDGGISLRNVYRYDVFGDRFVSRDPAESYRYREALEICGIGDGAKDMAKRVSLLEECARDPRDIFGVLGRYHVP